MLTLPLALAGGIWGLFLTKTAIGATVIVGAVLLVGIVVNNAIIRVETANQIREADCCFLWADPGNVLTLFIISCFYLLPHGLFSRWSKSEQPGMEAVPIDQKSSKIASPRD